MKWLLCCLCILTQQLNAQQLRLDQYNAISGLAGNEVNRIAQGPNGVMYFGTPNGVSCYDGASFFNYNGSNGFTEGFINHIETRTDSMLIFPYNASYYSISGRTLVKHKLPTVSYIRSLVPAGEEGYYAAAKEGLFLFNKGKITGRIPIYEGEAEPGIVKAVPWQDSLIVIGRTGRTLDVFNRFTWKKIAAYPKLYVRDICADKNGNIWLASIQQGVLCLSPGSLQNGKIVFAPVPRQLQAFNRQEFRSIVTDRKGHLWMATIRSGIFDYDPATGIVKQYTTAHGLISNTVFCLYADKEDNIWIGTNNGLQKLVHKDWASWSSKDGLPADLVLDIMRQGDHIYSMGYYGLGLVRKDGSVKKWNPLSGGDYFSRFLKEGNAVWLFGEREVWRVQADAELLQPKVVYKLKRICQSAVAAGNGNLLLAGDSGIALLNNKGIETLLTSSPASVMAIADDRLYTAYRHNRYVVYDMIHHSDDIALSKKYELVLGDTNLSDEMFCLVPGKNGLVAAGSAQQGFFLIDEQGRMRRSIDMHDGLSSNSVRALYWLNDTVILAGTGAGIDRVTLSKDGGLRISSLSAYYGFFSSIYCFSIDDYGDLLIGSESGLIRIHKPGLLESAQAFAPVIISSFSLLHAPDSAITISGRIQLSHDQNGFTVTFGSPSFTNERFTRYSYYLQGSGQKEWSNPSTQHTLTFSGLSPGHYTLSIKAADDPEGKVTTLEIHIAPPFWQKWWFLLLGLFILLGAGYALYRYRIQQLLRVEKIRQKISSDLHDDIGATLTGVSFLTEMARSKDLPEITRQQYLSTATEQTKNISERLSDIVWSINPGYDQLDKLLYKMRRYAGELLESKGIDYAIDFPEQTEQIKLKMDSRQHLYLIFKEALNNTAKYAEATKVEISVTIGRQELELVVADNGRGFEMGTTIMGNGIVNMQRRAGLAGGSCVILSAPGQGTTVRGILPLK